MSSNENATISGPKTTIGGDEYWSMTQRPIAGLAFLLPLMLIYELGAMWVGSRGGELPRSGADTWMRKALMDLGLTLPGMLPVMVIAVLVVWQIAGRYSWRIKGDVLAGMLAESVVFALTLLIFGELQGSAFRNAGLGPMAAKKSIFQGETGVLAVNYVGAGIYEEVLFRLCLLPACYVVLRMVRVQGWMAMSLAVMLTSVVFAGAHYLEPGGGMPSPSQVVGVIEGIVSQPQEWFGFAFRAVAGMYFAVLFLGRGLGVAVGCHVAYDVIVGILMV